MKHNGLTKAAAAAAALLLAASSLAGCGKTRTPAAVNYADGTYTGRSSDFQADESGNGAGYGEVELTLSGNRVVACTFALYELDGTKKDETYGAGLSQENRLKAQKAVQAADKYAQSLAEQGSLEGVDAISGATISHSEFIEAVNDALSKAAAN